MTGTNQAPAFSTDLLARTDAEGDVILSSDGLDADATDADGDTLTYSATGLPDGISIEPRHRRHQRHPQLRQRRCSHTVLVTVSDGTDTDTDSFTWTVTGTNQAPAFSTDLPTRTDAEGDVILSSDGLDADATDADGDT